MSVIIISNQRKRKGGFDMDSTQRFYNQMAPHYDKLFLGWTKTTHHQAAILDRIFRSEGFGAEARILDCACGIGTQAIGLAALGYRVTASDYSNGALTEARSRAAANGVSLRFAHADFRALAEVFTEQFDIVIAMDNALPHMRTADALQAAVKSIIAQTAPGGIFVASIRDYDAVLAKKPAYTTPYIHKTDKGQRVSFQTWVWEGDVYHLTQYIIDDEGDLGVRKFECSYRAVRRAELTDLLAACGCSAVAWIFPAETGWYQPIVIARK